MTDGRYDVRVSVTAGGVTKVNQSSQELDLNTAPPTLTLNSLSGDDRLNATEHAQGLTLSGTTDAQVGSDVQVSLNGQNYTAKVLPGSNGLNTFQINIGANDVQALLEGPNAYSISLTNTYGSTTTQTPSVLVDTIAPAAPALSLAEASQGISAAELADGLQTTLTLPTTGNTAAQAGDTLTLSVTDPQAQVRTFTRTLTSDEVAAGTVSITLPTTTVAGNGAYSLTATLTDLAGNTSLAATPVAFTIDTTAPGQNTDGTAATVPAPVLSMAEAASGISAAELADGLQVSVTLPTGSVSNDTLSFTVSAPDGTQRSFTHTITLSEAGSGVASLTLPAALLAQDGNYTIRATSTDVAGNTSTEGQLTVTLNAAMGTIADYAAHGITAPTSTDYANAGVVGVSAGNLAAINSAINAQVGSDTTLGNDNDRDGADTPAKVQAIVDAYNRILAEANDSNANAGNTTPDADANSNPSAQDYARIGANIGQAATDAAKLALLNDIVGASQQGDVDTVAEINELARIANDIQTVAAGQGAPLNYANYAKVGLSGVTPDNLAAVQQAIAAKNDNGSETDTLAKLQAVITAAVAAYDTAIDKIADYAETGTTAPLLQDYTDAGITGVTAGNLASINNAINAQAGADNTVGNTDDRAAADTAAEVQAIVNAYNRILAEANDSNTTAGDTTPDATPGSDPSAQDYAAVGANIGQAATDAENLALLNGIVGASQAADVDTVAEINNLARIANAIQTVAAGGTPSPALTDADFAKVGLSGVTADNLPAVLAAIAAQNDNGSETDSLSELQVVISNAVAAYTGALNAISGAAQNNNATPTGPTAQQYANAGVTGVNAGNLAAINDALNSAAVDGNAANSAAELQAIVNAYNRILAEANDTDANAGDSVADATPAADPLASDYAIIGADIGAAATDAAKLALLNDIVGASQAADVDTVAEINELARIANDIQTVAAGQGAPLNYANYAKAGLSGVTPDNLAAVQQAIAAKNDNGTETDTLAKLQAVITAAVAAYDTAIDKIADYAETGTTAPAQQDYADAGVTGVTAGNLAAINSAINAQTGADAVLGNPNDREGADTAAEVQAIVNAYNAILAEANDTDAIVGAAQQADVDTVAEINELARIANAIQTVAAGGTPTPALTVDDLAKAGLNTTGLTANNLPALLAAIAAQADSGADTDTLAKLQTLVDALDKVAPVFTSDSAVSAAENTATSTVVYDATADNDTGVTYIVNASNRTSGDSNTNGEHVYTLLLDLPADVANSGAIKFEYNTQGSDGAGSASAGYGTLWFDDVRVYNNTALPTNTGWDGTWADFDGPAGGAQVSYLDPNTQQTVTIQLEDGGWNGWGWQLPAGETIPAGATNVTVTATASHAGHYQYWSEGSAAASVVTPNMRVTDVDANSHLESATVTLSNRFDGDQLTVNGSAVTDGASGTISANGVSLGYTAAVSNGAVTITLSGTSSAATYQAALRQVGYTSTSQNPDTSVERNIEITVNDGVNNSNTAVNKFYITAINDRPTTTQASVTLAAVDEDTTNPTGSTVTSLFGSAFADVDGETLAGVVLTGNAATAGQGSWQWNNAGSWTSIATNLSVSNALWLSASTELRFVPATNYSGTPGALTARVADSTIRSLTNGSTHNIDASSPAGWGWDGPTDALSSTSVTLGTSITPVNDAPTGSVTVSGTAQVGQTLTASNNLADPDGPIGGLGYQWQVSDGNGGWTNIANATGATYVLTGAEQGKTVRAVATYSDGTFSNTASSSATAAVAPDVVNTAPTVTTTSVTNPFGATSTVFESYSAGSSLTTISDNGTYTFGSTTATVTGNTGTRQWTTNNLWLGDANADETATVVFSKAVKQITIDFVALGGGTGASEAMVIKVNGVAYALTPSMFSNMQWTTDTGTYAPLADVAPYISGDGLRLVSPTNNFILRGTLTINAVPGTTGITSLEVTNDVISGVANGAGYTFTVVENTTSTVTATAAQTASALFGSYFADADAGNTLTGGGGTDRFYAGDGNDTIVIGASDVAALADNTPASVKAMINGGGDYDTLRVTGANTHLDLTTIRNAGGMGIEENSRIESIERIDLATDTAAQTLTLNATDVNDMAGMNLIRSGSVSADGNTWTSGTYTLSATMRFNQLVVDGGANDTLVLAEGRGGWFNAGTIVKTGTPNVTYNVFQNNSTNSQVIVASGVAVTNNDQAYPVVNPTLSIDGQTAGDQAGWSVSNAGDVNGDGYDDLIIGAIAFDPAAGTNAGRSYVVFGTSAGTLTTPLAAVANGTGGFVIDGAAASGESGFAVSAAGDLNGDGLADLIVGSRSSLQSNTFVIFGKATTTAVNLASIGTNGYAITGQTSGDSSGYSVSAAGDVNGDGIADLIVGAPTRGTNAGVSYVVFGTTGNTTINLSNVAAGSGGFAINGQTGGDQAGYSVSNAGDVNGDGLADVIVGSPYWNASGNTGRGYVVFGKTDGTAVNLSAIAAGTAAGFTITGQTTGDYSNTMVSAAGDVNGDGLADVIVGAFLSDPVTGADAGRSYVVFGKAGSAGVDLSAVAAGSGGFVINGACAGDQSGRAVSSAGDINGDGLADLLVSAYGSDPNGKTNAGSVYVVFGKTGTAAIDLSDIATGQGGFVINGQSAGDVLGQYAVSAAGDINGDGYADLVIGSRTGDPAALAAASDAGKTYVIFGGPQFVTGAIATGTGTSADELVIGTSGNDTLTGGGGVDRFSAGLGNDTIVLTASDVANLANNSAAALKARVDGGNGYDSIRLSGGANLDLTAISNVGAMTGATGENLSRISDIERIDLATDSAANTLTLTATDVNDMAGMNLIRLGASADGATWASGTYTLSATMRFNQLVVDGGANDTLVLAEGRGGWFNAGTIVNSTSSVTYNVFQNDSTNSQVIVASGVAVTNNDMVIPGVTPTASIDGQTLTNYSGASVSNAGDVNGDGYDDIIVGAWGWNSFTGRSYVVFGTSAGTLTTALSTVANGTGGFVINGQSTNDYSGYSVSAAGDLNGDGLADLIVGAYYSSATAANAGRSYVIYGKTDTGAVSLATIAGGTGGFALNAQSASDSSGGSVSAAGDVNGDGIADLVIGASGWATGTGRAYVVFGQTGLTGVNLANVAGGTGGFVMTGESTGHNAGISVSNAGDVNGDGLADVIVGADSASGGNANGRTYVVFGKTDGAAISLASIAAGTGGGFMLVGQTTLDYSGHSVSAAGDVNGDGLADLIVGAYQADPASGSNAGKSYVVFGKADSAIINLSAVAAGTGGFVINGQTGSDMSGVSVSSAGDINGDGLADLIVGAYFADTNGGADAGRTYVVFGQTGTTGIELSAVASGQGGFVINGQSANDHMGQFVSAAGDINGDGYADLVVGAPDADPNGSSSGKTYVIFGGPQFVTGAIATGTGTSADELVIGTSGNDTLTGGGGVDRFSAGLGNDTIVLTASDVTNLANNTAASVKARVDGGNGYDSIRLSGGASLDLTAISNVGGMTGATGENLSRISDIERFDLATDTAANTLTLTATDVNDMAGMNLIRLGASADGNTWTNVSGTALADTTKYHQVVVDGGANDVLTLATGNGGWYKSGRVNNGTNDYFVWQNDTTNSQVLVSTDVTVNNNDVGVQSVISLGAGNGNLIAPVQVGGNWYYFWDRNGNGRADTTNTDSSTGTGDGMNHNVLDGLFNKDINGVTNTTVANVDGAFGTTDIYRYGTINGYTLALPTIGSSVANNYKAGTVADNTTAYQTGATLNAVYSADSLLGIWDQFNGTGTTAGAGQLGIPPGWEGTNYYWSATPSGNGHALTSLGGYAINSFSDGSKSGVVALQLIASPSIAPVVLDLNRDGTFSYTQQLMDVNSDGRLDFSAWAAAPDGVLVWNKYGDDTVRDSSQYEFTQYGGRTDLEGLAAAFDSNGDGVFDAADAKFAEFAVWQDLNGDGVSDAGEVKSLADWGIALIDLLSDGVVRNPAEGVTEAGRTQVTMLDGSTLLAADAAFEFRTLPVAHEPVTPVWSLADQQVWAAPYL